MALYLTMLTTSRVPMYDDAHGCRAPTHFVQSTQQLIRLDMNINIHVYGLFTVSRSRVEHNAELGYYNKFSQVAIDCIVFSAAILPTVYTVQ